MKSKSMGNIPMSGAREVLLISRDVSLAETVREIMGGSSGGRPVTVATTADAVGVEALGGVGLLLIHLGDGDGLEPVGRLLGLSSRLRRPIPVLALADSFVAEQSLALFRMGVADVLSRSHHLDRLGALVAAVGVASGLHARLVATAGAEAAPRSVPMIFSASWSGS